MNNLVAIVGPTGVGKSRLALRLAKSFDGEIVSADSRQVYRHMDIGTAKPNPEDLSFVPHHLIDIINPDEQFGLSQYQQLAYRDIEDIHRRGKPALLVGGTGQYVWSILEGWKIPRVRPDLEFRRSLEARVEELGADGIYQELVSVDPIAAQRINPSNVRRVIRALEVRRNRTSPLIQFQNKEAPPFNIIIIGLTMSRAELYHIVDQRVDDMVARGLVEEVKNLIKMRYAFNLPAMSGIGYRQMGLFINGEMTLSQATERIKFETHRFIRHQYNWFRLKDDRIKWFNISEEVDSEIITLLNKSIGIRFGAS